MRVASVRLREALCALLATALATWSARAPAVEKVTCVEAAEEGQSLRKEGRLVSARDRLVVCASLECPEVVSQDCTGWLGEVQRSLASVVVKVRDPRGELLGDASVSLDGAIVAERTPTGTIEIDPGDHVVGCQRVGFAAAQQRVHLAQGERGREVLCQLAPLAPATATDVSEDRPAPLPIEALGEETASEGALPWIVWPLGGLGIAGITGFAAFGLSGKSDEHTLAGTCAPYCTPSQVDPITTKFVVADISLAVGIVALGAAALIGILHSAPPAHVRARTTSARDPQLPPQVRVMPLQNPLQH